MFHNIEKDNLLCHTEPDHISYYDAYDICMAICIFNNPGMSTVISEKHGY